MSKKEKFIIGISVFIVVAAVIAVFVFYRMDQSVVIPASTLDTEPRTMQIDVFKGDEILNTQIQLKDFPFTMWVNESFEIKDNYVSGKIGDMPVFIYCDDSLNAENVIKNVFLPQFYSKIVMSEYQVENCLDEIGFYRNMPTEYAVYCSKIKVSFRSKKVYELVYAVGMSKEKSTYIIVATDDVKEIAKAKELLDYLAGTLVEFEVGDN